jgi:hypothetical protein
MHVQVCMVILSDHVIGYAHARFQWLAVVGINQLQLLTFSLVDPSRFFSSCFSPVAYPTPLSILTDS